jgi:hypothetical protein
MTARPLNPIRAQLQGLPAEAPSPLEPDGPLQRRARSCPPPDYAIRAPPSLDQARADMRAAIDAYLALPAPEHMLLIRAVPGVGKTTAGVETAEACAARGWRVAYAGPRHDFFVDVTAIAQHPKRWYEWLPRTEGNETVPETCREVKGINPWLQKGYQGIDYCAGVCGWDYVNNRCVWHRQKGREEPVIYIQHQHVASGHPMDFRVLIGDENPLQAFLWQWDIPADQVRPKDMPYDEPLTEILIKLAGLCASETPLKGLELMDGLGGPAEVLAACEGFVLPATALAAADVHSSFQAEAADYFHLPKLVPLLVREAEAARDDRLYPPRLIAGKGKLILNLRRYPDARLPAHVIWLDATGNEHIYHELFGRPVQVVEAAPQMQGHVTVVTDRTNGKGDFKAEQAAQLVRKIVADHGYTNPAVVTFKGAQDEIAGPWQSAHFYGARGTNRLEKCDALFVVGAPMPNRDVLIGLASQLYFDRMVAFGENWKSQYVAYRYVGLDGRGVEYPAGGFWGDKDLQALVWQRREAEIIQAVHRARPVLRAVPIYLLSNLPIPELPVDRLATAAELLGSKKPEKVRSLYDWDRLEAFVAGRDLVAPKDIRDALGVKWETAKRYWQLLLDTGEWEVAPDAVIRRRGRQPLTIRRITSVSTSL